MAQFIQDFLENPLYEKDKMRAPISPSSSMTAFSFPSPKEITFPFSASCRVLRVLPTDLPHVFQQKDLGFRAGILLFAEQSGRDHLRIV